MKIRIRQATSKGCIEMCDGGVCDLSYPQSNTRRGRVQNRGGYFPTVTSTVHLHRIGVTKDMQKGCVTIKDDDGELYDVYIRRLTPKEEFRAMGFTDEDYEKAAEVNAPTNLYKQAGNSIVVPVLEAIFRQLL